MTESTTEYTPTQYTTGELAKRCGVSVRQNYGKLL